MVMAVLAVINYPPTRGSERLRCDAASPNWDRVQADQDAWRQGLRV